MSVFSDYLLYLYDEFGLTGWMKEIFNFIQPSAQRTNFEFGFSKKVFDKNSFEKSYP